MRVRVGVEGSRTNGRQHSGHWANQPSPTESLSFAYLGSLFPFPQDVLLVRQRSLHEQSLTPDAVVRITISVTTTGCARSKSNLHSTDNPSRTDSRLPPAIAKCLPTQFGLAGILSRRA